MAVYLISYDINEKDEFEYEGLWAHLKKIGAVRILYSEWVVAGDANRAAAIYDKIAPLIQGKDRLLVSALAFDAAWDKLLINDASFKKLMGFAAQ